MVNSQTWIVRPLNPVLNIRRAYVESRAHDPAARWRTGHAVSRIWWHEIGILEQVQMPTCLQLLQIAKALDPYTPIFGPGQGRKEQRRQNGDNCDDHQQFDQCETPRQAIWRHLRECPRTFQHSVLEELDVQRVDCAQYNNMQEFSGQA